ncbi:unnamed protein product [Durusdinium trenchii]|uniref:Uncharacterized protein n=1 Tax=Durusdinium trenchii TaxID=1381693 RepID=A0ABP0JKL0_9DINO
MRVSVLLRLQRRYIYIAWQRPRRRQKIVSHFSCLADALLLQSNLKILEIVLTFRTLFRRKSELAATTATRTDQDNFPNDPLVKLAEVCFQAIPPVLEATGKVKNPWPNVDALSGTCML